jgi:hypothetical protein
MSIARNYDPQKIGRPNTLVGNDNIRSPSSTAFRLVEKRIVPALKSVGKYGVKQLAKAGTATLPTIGQGAGLVAGAGISALTNPELIPYLGTGGAILGKKGGQYLQKKANKAIEAW